MKAITNKNHKGFSLVELITVVAIIAIIMAYAIPAYRDYVVRSKASECLPVSTTAKLEVSQFWLAQNTLPNSNADVFLPVPSSFATDNIDNIEVIADGVIVCSYNNNDSDLSGNSISLTPTVANGNLSWACSANGLEPAHIPDECD
jgi:type IV pilus assembly protein PilA